MKTKTGYSIIGDKVEFFEMSFIKGSKALLANGYKQCPNKLYFTKNNKYAHYNKLSRIWIIEIWTSE